MLAIHLRPMLSFASVPVAKKLAERNREAATMLEEYHVFFPTYEPGQEKMPIPHAPYVFLHPCLSKDKPRGFMNIYKQAGELMRQKKIDVITVQDPYFLGLIGHLLRRKFGTPLNIQIHFPFLSDSYWKSFERRSVRYRAPLGRWLISRADSLYVNSSTEKQALAKGGFPEKCIWFNPYAIDPEEFTWNGQSPALSFHPGDGKKILLFVGRLSPEKDIPTLVRALALVSRERADVELAVVGEGPERPRLERLAAELDVESKVHFTGFVPYRELRAYYRAADLVLVSSFYEGTCRVIQEAAMENKTVVTTDTAGAVDAVQDGINGFLVRSRQDPEAFAKSIIDALSDPTRLKRMGEAHHRYITERYSIDSFFRLFVTMLEQTSVRGKR